MRLSDWFDRSASCDLRGYLAGPPTADELLLGELAVSFDLDDDVDYDALYGEREHGR